MLPRLGTPSGSLAQPAELLQGFPHAGQLQAAGDFLQRVGVELLALGHGLIHGRHEQVFQQFAVALGDELRIDLAMQRLPTRR